MNAAAHDGAPVAPEEPDPPMVELAVHHVRMPVGEHLSAAVVLCSCTGPTSLSLVLSIGPVDAEALIAALRGAAPAGGKTSWVDRCVQALIRATALHGRRLLLRLVPGPADMPMMRLEATDELSILETPIPVVEGLLASLQWRIPLLADARLLHPAGAEGAMVSRPALEAPAGQPAREAGGSPPRLEARASTRRRDEPRPIAGVSGASAWHSAKPGPAGA